MVLLGMLGHDIVDALDPIQVRHERLHEFRVDGVDENGLFRPLDQVSVVRRSIRQRDKRIEQPSVPMDHPNPIHRLCDLSHFSLH